ncbi:MAG: BPL-N domain-containing protein [Candidatus Heimdallarchaeaceae archaeon]
MSDKKTIALIFLLSILVIVNPFMLAANKPTENHGYSINHLVGVKVAIYNGSGAWGLTKTLLPKFLDWAGCTYSNVSGQDIINGILERFDILLWPGGDYVAYWGEMGLDGKAAVQEFIANGGGYFGICAGGYYACDYMVWMDDGNYPPPDYKVEGDELNLDLFQGVAWGPIFELADRPDPGYAMVTVNINHNHPITRELPDQMRILYVGGPYFVPYEEAENNITILGIYDLTRQNAIVSTTFGDGRVFLISPHAEVEEDSDRDGNQPYPDLADEGSDWPLLYKAIEWLAFKSPEDTNRSSFQSIVTIPAIVILIMWRKKRKTEKIKNL